MTDKNYGLSMIIASFLLVVTSIGLLDYKIGKYNSNNEFKHGMETSIPESIDDIDVGELTDDEVVDEVVLNSVDNKDESLDLYKDLGTGFNLIQVKRMITIFEDGMLEDNKDSKLSDDDIKTLEEIADIYGTTLEELRRVPYIEDNNLGNKGKTEVEVEQPNKQGQEQGQSDKSGESGQPSQSSEISQPSKPSGTSGTLELKTDKWHTKEQKEAARQRAIEYGDETWEQRALVWEKMSDSHKEFSVSPYDIGTDGTIYYDNLDHVHEQSRHLYKYKEGKGWYFYGSGLRGL